MSEPTHFYPGTTVYRNKLGIQNAATLEEVARRIFLVRYEALPCDLPVSVEGYRAVHRHLLQDVYDWAGEFRSVTIIRTGPFCRPEYIQAQLGKRFAAIEAENHLRNLPPDRFAAQAAEHLAEINAIHPFLDGNGRTMRAFLEILAEQAGHRIDPTRIVPDDWNRASALSFHRGDTQPLVRIVLDMIAPAGRSVEAPMDEAWLRGMDRYAPMRSAELKPPAAGIDDDLDL